MEPLRPIRNKRDHAWALKEIERLWNAKRRTPDGDRLEVLALLVTDYEAKRWPIPKASGLEVLKFMMEQGDRTQSDLAKLVGSRSRASEILSGKRAMSKAHIRRISSMWHIPAEALMDA